MSVTNVGRNDPCPCGSGRKYKKGCLLAAPSPQAVRRTGYDYHWYRQDADGDWSHKPGQGAVRRLDGNNVAGVDKEIHDPRDANRKSEYIWLDNRIRRFKKRSLNYTDHGGCFCIPTAGIEVGNVAAAP